MTDDDATALRFECLRLSVEMAEETDVEDVVKVAEIFFEFVTGATMSSKQ